jgi:3-mercaptopyruvate sulfurtransferase SseA
MIKHLKQALFIVILAILTGISYNSLLPTGKALPWVKEKHEVTDSTLFNTNNEKIPEAKAGELLEVNFEQMKKIVDHPDFFLIDARLEDMYQDSHIGNAINIYPYWDEDRYMMALQEVPYDKTIVVYCDGGACDLSHSVAETLQQMGIEKIFLYIGGWEEWSQKQNLNK